jgi:hypothetical protein
MPCYFLVFAAGDCRLSDNPVGIADGESRPPARAWTGVDGPSARWILVRFDPLALPVACVASTEAFMNRKILSVVAVILGSTFATSARAQQGTAPASSTATTPIAARVEDDSPDHERFVGHFAVGYFGISQIPIGTQPATDGGGTVTAPIIGVRYWLRRGLGIDAGIGLGFQGGGQTVTTPAANGQTTTVFTANNGNAFAFALHAGVPIALAEGHHYVFEFVPEANFGFATGSVNATPDISLTGVRFDLGARIGAELHFGFIGVPELALQASVGLYLDYAGYSTSQGGTSTSGNKTTLATTVLGEPWAIFANTISALYYF